MNQRLLFTNTKVYRIAHISKTSQDILDLLNAYETEHYQKHFYIYIIYIYIYIYIIYIYIYIYIIYIYIYIYYIYIYIIYIYILYIYIYISNNINFCPISDLNDVINTSTVLHSVKYIKNCFDNIHRSLARRV